jgi:hypothetical protein
MSCLPVLNLGEHGREVLDTTPGCRCVTSAKDAGNTGEHTANSSARTKAGQEWLKKAICARPSDELLSLGRGSITAKELVDAGEETADCDTRSSARKEGLEQAGQSGTLSELNVTLCLVGAIDVLAESEVDASRANDGADDVGEEVADLLLDGRREFRRGDCTLGLALSKEGGESSLSLVKLLG